ncbi:MAG: hypothetical protein Q8867_07875 [Bacteroidota bacterium]|nr:hypothetical protein [Bacteroidota bacterium]
MDFTLKTYKELITTLKSHNYTFQTYRDFIAHPASRAIILRHDVDKLPYNALQTAIIEYALGIAGSYYFRIVKESYREPVIRTISMMGHEIGYHYEDLVTYKGNTQAAYESFCRNLKKFREFVPVMTISMHGSPLSRWDNRNLWDKYNYRELGLTGEPYFDLDYTRILYLTDTGRAWNKFRTNIRDKSREYSSENLHEKYRFRTSREIMDAAVSGTLPQQVMITMHPQRWTDNFFLWTKELLIQNIKNFGKRQIVNKR